METFAACSLHDILNASPLRKESVDDRCSLWNHWCLAQVGQYGEYWMEGLKLLIGTYGTQLDSSAQLSQDYQVEDEWARQQGVLR